MRNLQPKCYYKYLHIIIASLQFICEACHSTSTPYIDPPSTWPSYPDAVLVIDKENLTGVRNLVPKSRLEHPDE